MSDPAGTLSGGQRQAIAIARAIFYGSRCLILDEPTAALAVRQTEQVLDQVRAARDAGQAVILITHNLEQALSVADSAVVLARGRVVGSFDAPSAEPERDHPARDEGLTGQGGRVWGDIETGGQGVGTMDQVVLITGGSSGFGYVTALTLARRGYRVFAGFRGSRHGFDVESERLMARSATAGAVLETVRLDVTDDESVRAAVGEIDRRADGLDVLVNCAGYGLLGPLEATPVDLVRQLFETNVFGVIRVVQAVLPSMRRRGGGTILDFGSDVGLRANLFQAGYAASKFALEGLTQVLRWELQQFGIRVAMIEPGWYATEFGDSLVRTFEEGKTARLYEPLVSAWNDGVARVEGPNSNPQEVADLVVRVIEAPAPRFHNAAGWNPVRLGGVRLDEIDEYEEALFDYYGLGGYAGPWRLRRTGKGASDA